MLNIILEKQAVNFLKKIPEKHWKQIASEIKKLKENPTPQDSKKLKWYNPYKRIDSWEYRVIYKQDWDLLKVILIWKRNDWEVYKQLERIFW